MSDTDRTVTLKLPKIKNPFKKKDGEAKKHKRHPLLWLVVIYLVIKDVVDTMTINGTLEGIVKSTKLDRSTFKDVDYTADYILNPFSLFGGLFGDFDLQTILIVALIVVIILLVISTMKNNKKDEENHS